jgi:hypothetical protein
MATFDITDNIRIGCKRDARKALAGELPLAAEPTDGSPRGSRGASRTTYRAGDVVYKVCNGPWVQDITEDDANRYELASIEHARSRDVGRMYVTPATGWNIDGIIVLAMPRLEVTAKEARHLAMRLGHMDEVNEIDLAEDEIMEAADELGVSDMHPANWMFDAEGRPWIVDLNL